jgi:hypothetical protein
MIRVARNFGWAMESDWLHQEIEFAIGSKKYERRLFTIFVGSAVEQPCSDVAGLCCS